MCGIAGVVSRELAAAGRLASVVEAMTRRLEHRGPDGLGVESLGATALGAARLAVIDPRPHPQPLVSSDGRWTIAYNGEVYDHRELRRELEADGERFSTDTDTEVVLAAVRRWGREAPLRLEGMYAYVALEHESGRLLGARDRLGQKPLFLHRDSRGDGRFAFSSFLPSFLELPGFMPEIDERSMLDVIELGYVLGPKTPWRDVEQLPPGHGFEWRPDASAAGGGTLDVAPWFSLADAFRAGPVDPSEVAVAEERFGEALERAVQRRLVADVPLGALLSGGLDSSSVVAMMGCHQRAPVRTFCLGFDDPAFDEREAARHVAAALGTDHHEEVARLDVEETLMPAIGSLGEPLADSSVLPTWLVSRMAREHVTVVLTGDGGDELLAGYETFRADRVRAWLHRLPAFPVRTTLHALARAMPADTGKVSLTDKIQRFAAGVELGEAEAHFRWRALQDHAEALALMVPEARDVLDGYSPVERFRALDQAVAGRDLVDRASFVDLSTYLPDDILVKVDRCSMAHGLEARSPFLDSQVVAAAAALPGRSKLRGLTTKWILRRQQRDRLPRLATTRAKRGFSAPAARWLLGPLRETFLDLATPERLDPLGLDATAVRRLHEALERRERSAGWALWAVLTLAAWAESLSGPPS